MLGINLPDFPRNNIQETTSPSWDMFSSNFEKAGFRKLGTDEMLRTNDVILMCISGTQTHHAASFLDPQNHTALHNLGEGRMLDLCLYVGYWETASRTVCRSDSINHN
ncbi:MAG: hypothetical protein ACKPJF_03460 [Dolichospermum sp.]